MVGTCIIIGLWYGHDYGVGLYILYLWGIIMSEDETLVLKFKYSKIKAVFARRKLKAAIYSGIESGLTQVTSTTKGMAVHTRQMKNMVDGEIRQQYRDQKGKTNKIRLKLDDTTINKISSRLAQDYLKRHTRGHSSFNPAFAGGYANPSTPGTAPWNRSTTLIKLRSIMVREIQKALKQRGFA